MQIYLRVLECARGTPTCSAMALLSHRQGWWLAGLISVFPCIFSAPSTNENPDIAYRTGTSEVRVSFFATDENERLVADVTTNDFAIVDDETVVREFRSYSRAKETALDLVVVVDASESVARSFHRTLGSVGSLMQQSLLSSGDRFSIVTFAGLQSALLCANDCANTSARKRLDLLKAAGATLLFDTLLRVGTDFSGRQRPDLRQILILFSDGNDTISRASAREALDELMANGVVLYGVNLTSAENTPESGTLLEQMAEATGGRVLPAGDANLLQTILAEQRASYLVTYELPSRARGLHTLRILPRHNLNLQFHCKRGYYYDDIR
jgi:VWFA-related protein